MAAAVPATAGPYPQKQEAGPAAAVLSPGPRPPAGGARAVCPDIPEGIHHGAAAGRRTALGGGVDLAGTYGPGTGGAQAASEGSAAFPDGTAAVLDPGDRPLTHKRPGDGAPAIRTSLAAPGIAVNTAAMCLTTPNATDGAAHAAGSVAGVKMGGEYDAR